MKAADFASVVPRIKVWETKFLTKGSYEKLIESKNLEDAKSHLQDTIYAPCIESDDLEKELNVSFATLCRELNKIPCCENIIDFTFVKYDYHNVKTLVKGKLLNKDFSDILVNIGTIEVSILVQAIKSELYDTLNPFISKAIRESLVDFEENKDPQRIEIIVDKYMFEHMKSISNKLNSSFVDTYMKRFLDLTNLKTTLRVKRLNQTKKFLKDVLISGGNIELNYFEDILIEDIENLASKLSHTIYSDLIKQALESYLSTNSLSNLEKQIDNYLMDYMKNAKYVNLGIEPVFAYIYSRETEIKNLRIILAGKANKVDNSIIRERLRDIYV